MSRGNSICCGLEPKRGTMQAVKKGGAANWAFLGWGGPAVRPGAAGREARRSVEPLWDTCRLAISKPLTGQVLVLWWKVSTCWLNTVQALPALSLGMLCPAFLQ